MTNNMPEEKIKTYTLKEIAEHSNNDSAWVLINDGVYDVTKFLDEHPGGPETLLDWAGKEATEAFEDVAHSMDARTLMEDYKIGELSEEDQKEKPKANGSNSSSCCWLPYFLLPLGVALTGVVLYKFYLHINK